MLAAGRSRVAGAGRRDGARAPAAAGLGALRRVRPGAGVLMGGLREGLGALARAAAAPRDTGAWWNGRETER